MKGFCSVSSSLLLVLVAIIGSNTANAGHNQGNSIAPGQATEFCYDKDDCSPRTWPGLCQSGSLQSPINLPYNLLYHVFGKKVDLRQNAPYFQYQNFILTNNGHSVQASIKADLTSTSVLDGSLLGQPYVFSQIHFHWGSNILQGSEHTFNFKRYPMEGHLVHYAAKYASLTDAVNSGVKGAVAVVGVMFEESLIENPGLVPIINAMTNVRNATLKTSSTGLRLASFLPQSYPRAKNIVQYYGSLTTPGCNEVVFWNVIAHPEQISKPQIEAFRKLLLNAEGRTLVNNYRPLQNTNGRPITYVQSSIWS